jgi:hypothetical protein
MIIDVHAVIRDGQIAYLSAPYPPLPLRRPEDGDEPSARDRLDGTVSVAPASLFLGTAFGLTLVAVVVAVVAPVAAPLPSSQTRRRDVVSVAPSQAGAARRDLPVGAMDSVDSAG